MRELNCWIAETRAQADVWIQPRHRGQQQGAGVVQWDGLVAARYDARKGTAKNPWDAVALQIIDFVRAKRQLSDRVRDCIDQGKFPVSTLRRLLGTPYVRDKVGVMRSGDAGMTQYPDDEVLKGLTRIVEDIGSGAVTVSDLKKQNQRIDYIKGIAPDQLPNPVTRLTQPQLLAIREETTQAKDTRKSQAATSRMRIRKELIPSSFHARIDQPRLSLIYRELKRLNADEFPNASAVMLRVFLELSLDHYLEKNLQWSEQKIRNSHLAQKLQAVANYFEKDGIMTRDELLPVRHAASGQSLLAAAVKTLHGYVHSRYFSAKASELRTAWDDLQPFMERLCQTIQAPRRLFRQCFSRRLSRPCVIPVVNASSRGSCKLCLRRIA